MVNWCLRKIGRQNISLSKRVKDSVKTAVKFINDFEKTAAEIAIDNGYDFVICGHIHYPEIRKIENERGSVVYLNSGDWVENLSALEYDGHEWKIYRYKNDEQAKKMKLPKRLINNLDADEIFRDLVNEFLMVNKK
jgi:UDP-2,3-diacylglucosamine pyrophosphatase LpxH